MNLKQGKYQASLCRGQNCCPQLIIENGQYIITDDSGGRVVLEQHNIKILVEQYQEYTEQMEALETWASGNEYDAV